MTDAIIHGVSEHKNIPKSFPDPFVVELQIRTLVDGYECYFSMQFVFAFGYIFCSLIWT